MYSLVFSTAARKSSARVRAAISNGASTLAFSGLCSGPSSNASSSSSRASASSNASPAFAARQRIPRPRRHDQVNRLFHMIKRQHLVEEHQVGIRHVQLVRRHLRQPLDPPHHVIGKEAHRPGGKRGQTRQLRGSVPFQVPPSAPQKHPRPSRAQIRPRVPSPGHLAPSACGTAALR